MVGLVSRRRFLVRSGGVALGAASLGAFLEACATASSSPSSSVAPSSLAPSVAPSSSAVPSASPALEGDLAYWWRGSADLQSYINDVWLPDFNKVQPKINVDISWKEQDLNTQIQTALQAGQGPDLVHTPGPAYATDFVKASFLEPLDDYATAYDWKSKIAPWALDAGRIQGNLFSLPENQETLILYTNKTLFDTNGWKAPTSREELEAIATEAMGKKIVPFAGGIGDGASVTEWYVSAFFNHYAGPDAMHQVLTGAIQWTDAVFVEAATLFNSYVQKGWFGGSVDLYFSGTLGALYAMHGEGKAAMDLEGSWHLADIGDSFGSAAGNANDWDWAPIPPLRAGVPAEMYALAVGGTIGIHSGSPVAAAAAAYLDWSYSDPKRLGDAIARGLFEFLLPVVFDPADLPSGLDQRLARFVSGYSKATSAGDFGFTSWTFMPAKTETFLYEGMNKVITGDLAIADYLAQLDATFKKELADGIVPPVPKPGV